MLRLSLTTASILGLLATPTSAVTTDGADDQISYTSRPDRLAVFLNDVAYAQDAVSLPGGVDVRVVLPDTIFPDTLILRENGERVPVYRLDRRGGPLAVQWTSESETALRDVTLEYLLSGVSWRPGYDMWLGADDEATVDLDLLAAVLDGALSLDDVDTQLVAGYVNLSSAEDAMSEISANQALAGYSDTGVPAVPTGQVNIQHVYDIGSVTAEPGDTVFLKMVGQTLAARRLHLWNAHTDQQVTVIYKVRNETELPFAEGVVRTYQAGMFIGSDPMETTPVGSEGSVTVGHLQDVRVKREESQTVINVGRFDYRYDVALSVSNHGPTTLHLEIVDHRRPEAEALSFSMTPAEDPGNLLRWQLDVEPGATETITYDFMVD
jgi:hypothetical protein